MKCQYEVAELSSRSKCAVSVFGVVLHQRGFLLNFKHFRLYIQSETIM